MNTVRVKFVGLHFFGGQSLLPSTQSDSSQLHITQDVLPHFKCVSGFRPSEHK